MARGGGGGRWDQRHSTKITRSPVSPASSAAGVQPSGSRKREKNKNNTNKEPLWKIKCNKSSEFVL